MKSEKAGKKEENYEKNNAVHVGCVGRNHGLWYGSMRRGQDFRNKD